MWHENTVTALLRSTDYSMWKVNQPRDIAATMLRGICGTKAHADPERMSPRRSDQDLWWR